MIDLKGMTDQQVEAIRHREGPAIVIAIPGAGKTRVITYRIADLLDDGAAPGEILAVTFTNKAAEEMRGRVGDLVGGTGRRVWISTFHSMCCRMLRREPEAFAVAPNFGIADRDASIQMITQAVASVTGKKFKDIANDDGPEGPSHMMQEISACKQEAILPPEVLERGDGALKETKLLHDVYKRYQALLKRNQMVDFDDMLMKVVLRFRTDHDLRKGYASRFRYLLVDEYQDTNLTQYEIVKQLASVHGNPFVVGDDDQAIYGWRGADAGNLLKFQNDFSDTKLYVLDRNFRSVGCITSAANSVIKNNNRFVEKTLIPVKPDGSRPRWVTCADEGQQAGFIAGEISAEAMRDRASLADTAILYRTNAQSRKLVEVLTSRGLPHRVLGSLTFYQRAIIKDMVSYLQLIANPRDDMAFTRLHNRPARGIGAMGFAQFCAVRDEKEDELGEDISLVKVLANRWHEGRIRSTGAEGFRQLRAVIARLRKMDKDSAGPMMKAVLDTTRVREKTKDALKKTRSEKQKEKYEDQLELLEELQAAASEFDEQHGGGLTAYLEFVALMQAEDKNDDGEPKVTLMSCHRAKGTEFRNVYLVGCVEGLFPILGRRDKVRPGADPGLETAKELARLEEERRVFFVGMTRAEERLTFLTPLSRRFGSEMRDTQPSRFVMEAMRSGRVDEVAIEDTMLGSYRGSHRRRRRKVVL